MNGINPIWLTVIATLVAVDNWIGGGKVSLDHVFPGDWIPWIVGWCGFLGGILGFVVAALTTIISSKPGILISAPTAVAKAVIIFAIMVLGTFAFPGDARAQVKLHAPTGNLANDLGITQAKPPMITGNAEKDLQALWDKIVASSIADLNYAAAMAKNANTQTSGIRLQCINAIITLNQQASGANLKNADGTPMTKPDPHVFTDVESLAEVIDNLSPQGPLFVNCAGAAQLAKTNVLTFVNAVITGAAGFAAMPIIPGL